MKRLEELFKKSAIDHRRGIITDEHWARYVRTQLKPAFWNDDLALQNLAFTKMPLLKLEDLK